MDIRLLCGEIKGEDIIDIGEIVEVTNYYGAKITGRLNMATKEDISVRDSIIKIKDIVKIKRIKNEEK